MPRYIVYFDGENNYYDDSDFYVIGYDTATGKPFKHVYRSTRYAGYNPLEDSSDDKELQKMYNDKFFQSIHDVATIAAIRMEAEVGDIVKVTNPRARKHKGLEFEVLSTKSFMVFNRRESYTLVGRDGVQSNYMNCDVIKASDKKVEIVKRNLLLGTHKDGWMYV